MKKGPISNNFILTDEINRDPSKVQSALLEAIAEKQITIGNDTFKLNLPFIVLATQNPIEQSGTYRLPEAQLDRFMMKQVVKYPSKEEEKEMYKKLNSGFNDIKISKILNKKEVLELQYIVEEIYVSENIFEYVSSIIDSTRNPKKYKLNFLEKYLRYGISPRGGLALLNGAKALALISGRDFVIPEDIKKIESKVLSHRIILNYEAVADDISVEKIKEYKSFRQKN